MRWVATPGRPHAAAWLHGLGCMSAGCPVKAAAFSRYSASALKRVNDPTHRL